MPTSTDTVTAYARAAVQNAKFSPLYSICSACSKAREPSSAAYISATRALDARSRQRTPGDDAPGDKACGTAHSAQRTRHSALGAAAAFKADGGPFGAAVVAHSAANIRA